MNKCSYTFNHGNKKKSCQLDVAEEDLISLNGNFYCPYHLPVTDHNESKKHWSNYDISKYERDIHSIIDKSKAESTIADLTGVVFPSNISFNKSDEDIITLPGILFEDCKFLGIVHFQRIIFDGDVSFRYCTFDKPVIFEKSSFRKWITFTYANMMQQAQLQFNEIHFESELDFMHVNSNSNINFFGCNFIQSLILTGSKISGSTSFTACCVNALFNSREINIHGIFNIRDSIFRGPIYFDNSIFYHNVKFTDNLIHKLCSFKNTQFIGDNTFTNNIFSKDAIFSIDGLETQKEIEKKYINKINFSECKFMERADFTNREFLDSTIFRETEFTEAPVFHNSILHQDTDFYGAKFLGVEGDYDARCYRTLRLAMEQIRSRIYEGEFFSLEQRSIRNDQKTEKFIKALSYLYDKTSNYGQSIIKPLLLIIGVFLISALSYALILTPSLDIESEVDWDLVGNSIKLSAGQITRPFYFFTSDIKNIEIKDYLHDNSLKISLVYILSFFQSLFNVILLALLVFGVRWRFRRG